MFINFLLFDIHKYQINSFPFLNLSLKRLAFEWSGNSFEEIVLINSLRGYLARFLLQRSPFRTSLFCVYRKKFRHLVYSPRGAPKHAFTFQVN